MGCVTMEFPHVKEVWVIPRDHHSLTIELDNTWRAGLAFNLFELTLQGDSFFFFFSSRRRHTRLTCDWSSDVCSSDLRLRFPAITLKNVFMLAYDLKDFQLIGPGWIGDERYTLEATMPTDTTEEQTRAIDRKSVV